LYKTHGQSSKLWSLDAIKVYACNMTYECNGGIDVCKNEWTEATRVPACSIHRGFAGLLKSCSTHSDTLDEPPRQTTRRSNVDASVPMRSADPAHCSCVSIWVGRGGCSFPVENRTAFHFIILARYSVRPQILDIPMYRRGCFSMQDLATAKAVVCVSEETQSSHAY
jgi:hypothetical protein